MLSQLIYVSNRKPICTEQEIENILRSCEKNNPPLNITGVLLFSDTKFIQLVEGEAKVLLAFYDKVKKDDRHGNAMMISFGPIREKSFPSWHMGSKKISGGEVEFRTVIAPEDKIVFSSLLGGREVDGQKALRVIKRFF